MANKQKILLVEGEADKGFFKKVCKKLSLDATVKVALPKDLTGTFNTKGGVLSQLKLLQTQLEDGHITNIAAIVDADYIEHGSGTTKTLNKASDLLKPFGFEKRESPILSGYYFDHNDGLPSIGLWIMPDNKQEEGMIEDWLESCIKSDEKELYEEAKLAVQKIKKPKFKKHSQVKAQISTWLSWQKSPGHGLYTIAYNDLLDESKDEYKNLCSWLKDVFK